MNKFYLVAILIGFAFTSQAQDAVWACNDPAGGIQIYFDYNQNCPNAPGSLAGMTEIGFHSGANSWADVVDFNAANAVTAANIGNDTFVVRLVDPAGYYGVAVTDYNFVFNQGIADPLTPWGSEGKPDDGMGGCGDFQIVAADITETCATTMSIEDRLLDKALTVSPNPFGEFTVISIENRSREAYTVQVTSMTGQVVSRVEGFTGNEYTLERGNMNAGLYFVTFTNEAGQFITTRVSVQ